MSRARPSARDRPRRRTRSGAPHRWRRLVWIGLAVVAVLAGGLLLTKSRRSQHATRTRPPSLAASVLADSVVAANRRRDWDAALAWSLRLAEATPGVSRSQSLLAVAWHQFGAMQRPGGRPEQPALRTSLERIESELRTIASADSARVLAANQGDWLRAMQWSARAYEFLGLPLEALAAFAEIERRSPQEEGARLNAAELRQRLREPLER